MEHQHPGKDVSGSLDVEPGTPTDDTKTEYNGASLEDRDHNHTNPAVQNGDQNESKDTQKVRLSGWAFNLLVGSVTLAVLLIAFNATSVGTAIPAITSEFNTVNDVGWYSSSYLIANCVMVPFVGKLYRFFRIKAVFITFIAIFELGSLMAALSTSSMMLIIARAICGIGGSGILNGGSTIIAATVPIAERSFLNGIILGCFALGQAAGPLIGGALTQKLTWRWCFYINLPFGGAVILLFLFVVKLPVPILSTKRMSLLEKIVDIDIVGFVAFAAASIMLLIGLQWGGTEFPWNSATIIGLICGGVAMYMVVGGWFTYKGESALLPPRMLRDRINIMISITAFLQSGGTINSLYWVPVWLQAIKGANALQSGIMILPLILSQLVASVVCGAVVQKTGYYLPEVILGNALVAIGAGLTSTFSPATSLGEIIGYQIFLGAGRGFVMQMLVTAMQANVPKEDAPIATAYAVFSQLLGSALFSAIAKTIFTSSLEKSVQKFAPSIDPSLLIDSGITDIANVIPPDQVEGAILAYNKAINYVFYLQLAAAVIALLSGLGTGWKNLKEVNQEKEKVDTSDAEMIARSSSVKG